MNRQDILKDAERCICTDRENKHGSPEDSFKSIARIWSAYIAMRTGVEVKLNAKDAGVMLALFKIARISGNRFVADSYVDACGYLACAAEADEKERANERGSNPNDSGRQCVGQSASGSGSTSDIPGR